MSKKVLVLANGYAEEMMATLVMEKIRNILTKNGTYDHYELLGGSLVSSGKWYRNADFSTFMNGGVTPSGGFPTRSWKGFFADLKAGAFWTPIRFMNKLKELSKDNTECIIAVGDFILMALAIPAIKKKNIPLVFVPTAKSDYIESHFEIEKKYIKKYAQVVFPRDQLTADDLQMYGIDAKFEGNLIQDLLDDNSVEIAVEDPMVALLPGSREEAYGNFEKLLQIVELTQTKVHWAFVQAGSLNTEKFKNIFIENNWVQNSENSWAKNNQQIFCYQGKDFDRIAKVCVSAISLAGTASEQIVGLGKPVLGILGTGPQSTDGRMEDNKKLLGNAFIYEKDFPQGVVDTIEKLLKNPQEREKIGQMGLERMGKRGATKKIADYIVKNYLEKE